MGWNLHLHYGRPEYWADRTALEIQFCGETKSGLFRTSLPTFGLAYCISPGLSRFSQAAL